MALSIRMMAKPIILKLKYKKDSPLYCLNIGKSITAMPTPMAPVTTPRSVEKIIWFELALTMVRKSFEKIIGPCKN